MDQFLEIHKTHIKRNRQSEQPISIREIKSIISNLPTHMPGPDECTCESHQTFKEEIIPILYSPFRKTEAKEILGDLSSKDSTALIPSQTKTSQEKKTADQYLSLTQMQKVSTKYQQMESMYKEDYIPQPSGVYPTYARLVPDLKIKYCDISHHINTIG